MIDYEVRFDVRGPIPSGRWRRVMTELIHDAERAVAEHGRALVRSDYDRVHRYEASSRTGRAWRSVDVIEDPMRVTSGNVIYRAWLEGVGSRNAASRFKGYFTFRRVAQALRGQAATVARAAIRPHVRKLGGR
jgi:hypothetical protein